MLKKYPRSIMLVAVLACLVAFGAADEGERKGVEMSERREKRQCSCVSQYTPVNCRCKTAGANGELICRCDRAAILNNGGSATSQCSCGLPPPLYPPPPSPPPPPFTPPVQLPYSPASVYAGCQPVCRQNCMQSVCGNNVAAPPDGLADASDVSGCAAAMPQQPPSQCAFVCQRACNHGSGISSPPASYVVAPANGAAASAATGNGENSCGCTPDDDACTCGSNINALTSLNHDDRQPPLPSSTCYPTCSADDCRLACAGGADSQLDCDALCRANCQSGGCGDDEAAATDDFYTRTNYVYHNSNGNGAERLRNGSGGYGSGLLSDQGFEEQQQQSLLHQNQQQPILTLEALALLLQHQQQQLQQQLQQKQQQNWMYSAATPKPKYLTTKTTTTTTETTPTNYNGTTTDNRENTLNCFVKCPQSCQRACGKLKGAALPIAKNHGGCQSACVSMCSLNCQQQTNETGAEETTKKKADDSNKSSTTPQNIAYQKDTTLKTNNTSHIMMDEGAASSQCVPSCRPQCLQSCTAAYRKRSSASENLASKPHQYFQHTGHTARGWQSKIGNQYARGRMSLNDYHKHLERLAMAPLKTPYWPPTSSSHSWPTSKAVRTNSHHPISPLPLSYSSLTSSGNESAGIPDRIVHKKWASTTFTTDLSPITTTTIPIPTLTSTTTMIEEPPRVPTREPKSATVNPPDKHGGTAARNALKLKQWYEKIQRAGPNDQQPSPVKDSSKRMSHPQKSVKISSISTQKRHAVGGWSRRPLPVDDASADNVMEYGDDLGRQKQRRDEEDHRRGVKAPIAAFALRRQRRSVTTASVLSYLPPASHPRVSDMEHLRMLYTPSRFLALNDEAVEESNIEFRRQSDVGDYYPDETARIMDAERWMHNDAAPSDDRDANSGENSDDDGAIMIPPLPIVRSDIEDLSGGESDTKLQRQRLNAQNIKNWYQTNQRGSTEGSRRFNHKHEIEDVKSDKINKDIDTVAAKNNPRKGYGGIPEESADRVIQHPPLRKTKQLRKLQNAEPKQTIYGPWSRRKTVSFRRRRIPKTPEYQKTVATAADAATAPPNLNLAKTPVKPFRKRSMKPLIGKATFDMAPTEMRHHLPPIPMSNGARWLERKRNESNATAEKMVDEASAEPPIPNRKSGACDAVCHRICAGACLSSNSNSQRQTSRASSRSGRMSKQSGNCVTGCVGKCTSKCLN